jgi:ElaA protein
MQFFYKKFEELKNQELYQVLKLRTDVFVVEQNCPYPELDNKDFEAIHVLGLAGSDLVAVARILPPGVSYPEWSFGRIATSYQVRGKGVGRALIRHMMDYMDNNHVGANIRISAQSHLEQFYAAYGFRATGKNYLEDGIPHLEMLFVYKSQ